MNKNINLFSRFIDVMLGASPFFVGIIAAILCNTNSFMTVFILGGVIFAISQFFCAQTKNKVDVMANLMLCFLCNVTYFFVVLRAWDSSLWYWGMVILFTRLFNYRFINKCITFYDKESVMYYVLNELKYLSTVGIDILMSVYLVTDSTQWEGHLKNALIDIFVGYIK